MWVRRAHLFFFFSMKSSLLFTVALCSLVLISCTPRSSTNTPVNPYPTVASGATGTLTPTTQGSNFSARGSEPFWSMELTDSEAKVSQPKDDGSTGVDTFMIQQSVNGSTITVKDARGEFNARIEKKDCVEPSGETVPYTAMVNYGTYALKGCATKK